MLSIAILGAGQRGTALVRALRQLPGVSMVAVVDRDSQAPGLAVARAEGIPVFTTVDELEGKVPVDILVDATGGEQVSSGLPGVSVIPAQAVEVLTSLAEEHDRLIERLLRETREKETVINSTHDGMIAVNERGEVTIFNAAAERLTGLAAAQALGRSVQEVIPNTRLPQILRTGRSELNQRQEMGQVTIVTNRVPVRDESGRIIGAVAVFRDIGEIEALAEEITNLKRIKLMLEAIIKSTQDAISVVDENGRGLLINAAYTRLTGLSEADIIGKPATVDIAEGESMHLKVLKTRRPVRNVRMKVGPGRRDVVVHVAPILVDGELKGSVGVIHDLSEMARLTEELDRAKRLIRRLEAKYTFDDIVGQSPSILAAVEHARRAADTPATVLLRGESGTGKELFAHAIHNASARRSGQFIRVNCAALTDTLLESELFGYVEGAFTGARKGGHRGLFEEASGGTIFLDEIGEISQRLQAKLLRVLQEKEIIRVGDNKPISVDVRVIAATNVHLELAIERGTFREDLYYRLNVVPIFVPPLRHRPEDLSALVEHLLRKYNQEYGRSVEAVSPGTMEQLAAYHWPGNIRELENVISRAVINLRFNETTVTEHHLPPLGRRGEVAAAAPVPAEDGRPLAQLLAERERQIIVSALKATGGNKTEAARRLGISTRSLYYKLERLVPDLNGLA
ncbi:MAG: sigma 54-interacting transcriptional regulator [Bacillota bacterium]